MVAILFLGGLGAGLGLVFGLLLRRLGLVVAVGASFTVAYLLYVFLNAPSSYSSRAGTEATEWQGRYAEWWLVLLVAGSNFIGFILAGAAAVLGRRGWRARAS